MTVNNFKDEKRSKGVYNGFGLAGLKFLFKAGIAAGEPLCGCGGGGGECIHGSRRSHTARKLSDQP